MDREGHVRLIVDDAKARLAESDGGWDDGLNLAEAPANLLDAGELVALRELPTRQVDLMRSRQPDPNALHILLERYGSALELYILA